MGSKKIVCGNQDDQVIDEPIRKRIRKENQDSPACNAGDKSLFASYVSPLLRKIGGMVWESIGGSTDASSLGR